MKKGGVERLIERIIGIRNRGISYQRKYTGGGEGARKWLTMESRIRSDQKVEVESQKKRVGGV